MSNFSFRKLILFFIFIALFAGCSGKKTETGRFMVIVFSVGDARLVHSGQEIPARPGMVVVEQDQLKTLDGSMDLQTKSGSAIRIHPFTTITAGRFSEGEGETRFDLDHGGLLYSLNRNARRQDFIIASPTAIASVRGTAFSMELDSGRGPVVRVIEGSVALSPRIRALEKIPSAQIESMPGLKDLAAVQKLEKVIVENSEGTLDSDFGKKLLEADSVVSTSPSSEAIPRIARDLLGGTNVRSEKTDISAREQAERDTLVVVSPETIQRMIENRNDSSAAEDLVREHRKAQESALNGILERASRVDLKTIEDIRSHYHSLETIVLKNKEQIVGAVIAVTSEELIVHTSAGVRRIKRDDVESQDF